MSYPLQVEVASNPLKLPGSLAAMIQALIGNITAGSLFAVLQSIGMGGAIPAIASAVAAIFGAGVGAGVATAAAGGGPNDEDPDGEGPAVDNAPGGDAGW